MVQSIGEFMGKVLALPIADIAGTLDAALFNPLSG